MGRPVEEGESLVSDHSPEVKSSRYNCFLIIYVGNIQGVTPESYGFLEGPKYRVRPPLLSVASWRSNTIVQQSRHVVLTWS
jgi:hypothetical protein